MTANVISVFLVSQKSGFGPLWKPWVLLLQFFKIKMFLGWVCSPCLVFQLGAKEHRSHLSEVHPSFTHTSPLIAAISNCSFPFQIPSCFLPPWEVYSLSTLKCLWDNDQRVPSEGWWRQADCSYYKAALAPRQIFHQFPISKSTFWPKGWNTSLSCFHFPKALLFVG